MKINYLPITVSFVLIASCLLSNLALAQKIGLYGMTMEGGANGMGAIFVYTPADMNYVKVLDFDSATNGSHPNGSLMLASDGTLYGMTHDGGAYNFGVLFQFNPATYSYTKKLDFNYAGAINGSYPHGSLMQTSDGKLYGMTEYGGAYNWGVLFQFNPADNTYTDDYDFGETGVSGVSDVANGQYPFSSLLQATDGKLYGMTSAGGSEGYGVLFQYDPSTSTYTKELDFGEIGVSGPINGDSPYGSLIQTSDGNIYGTTSGGGTTLGGVLFQYNPASAVYTKKFDFNDTNGIYPSCSLIKATDGNLYGMTSAGGIYNKGVLFQFNPATSIYTKKIDFAGATNGSYPYGSLMQATDGNLYGMTRYGGANGDGVLFQFNPSTSGFTKMLDFNGTNGQSPLFANLLDLNLTGINELSADNYISLFPNPATNQLTIHTSSTHNESVTVSVMNVLGQIMQEETLKWSSDINISIKTLSAGIYFIQMKTESGSVVNRFVKE